MRPIETGRSSGSALSCACVVCAAGLDGAAADPLLCDGGGPCISKSRRAAMELMGHSLGRPTSSDGRSAAGERRADRTSCQCTTGSLVPAAGVAVPHLCHSPAFGIGDTESQLYRADLDVVAVAELRASRNTCAANERTVLAAEVLDRGLAAEDHQLRVKARHPRRVELNR